MLNQYYYKRRLPHWQPPLGTFFITYRLAGSIPAEIICKMKEEYQLSKKSKSGINKWVLQEKYFVDFENQLENNLNEPHWFKNDSLAEIVHQSLHFRNNIEYELWAECIMSNHVHTVLSINNENTLLNKILQNHKKYTAVQCNKILNRQGPFWQEESFDTLIRNNSHFFNCIHYTLQNPVKAGFVKNWKEWKWSYLNSKIADAYTAIFEKSYL